MQCKDIPNEPILHFLAQHGGIGCTVWDCIPAMPDGVIGKLATAKMGRLIRRGLIDGCICGCRGDFELTDKGRMAIQSNTAVIPR